MRSALRLFNRYSKYHAKKTSVDGIAFASKAEATLYQYLKLEGIKLTLQPKVYLTKAKILYKPDFQEMGAHVYYEMKGMETTSWRLKRRLWIAYGPGYLLIYKMKGNKPYLFESINPSNCDE